MHDPLWLTRDIFDVGILLGRQNNSFDRSPALHVRVAQTVKGIYTPTIN